jgi:hypothetical protein
LAHANIPQLVKLLSCCEPLDEEDVLGEAFRKAGKLGEFSAKFDLTRSGILREALNDKMDASRQAELDGFYVYGLQPVDFG